MFDRLSYTFWKVSDTIFIIKKGNNYEKPTHKGINICNGLNWLEASPSYTELSDFERRCKRISALPDNIEEFVDHYNNDTFNHIKGCTISMNYGIMKAGFYCSYINSRPIHKPNLVIAGGA